MAPRGTHQPCIALLITFRLNTLRSIPHAALESIQARHGEDF
jgi:hypothetical protein